MITCLICGLYLQAGAGWLAHNPTVPAPHEYWRFDLTEVRNPYGSLAIGYEVDKGPLRLDLEARHQSSMATGLDRGENGLWVKATVFPFRH